MPVADRLVSLSQKRITRDHRMQRLKADLVKLRAERESSAKELAETYGMKVDEVRRRMMTSALVKKRRKPNLHNAKMSRIASILNAGMCLVIL